MVPQHLCKTSHKTTDTWLQGVKHLISIENNYILRKWFDDEEDEKMRLCYCMYIFFYTICLYYCTLFFYSCSWLLIWFPGWTGYSTGTMMTEVETNAFTVFFLKLYLIAILPFSLPFFLQIFFLSLKSVFCILFSSHVVDC